MVHVIDLGHHAIGKFPVQPPRIGDGNNLVVLPMHYFNPAGVPGYCG
jgi:hypothetical protein